MKISLLNILILKLSNSRYLQGIEFYTRIWSRLPLFYFINILISVISNLKEQKKLENFRLSCLYYDLKVMIWMVNQMTVIFGLLIIYLEKHQPRMN